MFLDNLKQLTFTFFKSKMEQREELCLELFQVSGIRGLDTSFYPFLISTFLGEDKFICVRCFEIIGEYSAAACTHSGAFLEQVITTNVQCSYDLIDTQCEDNTQDDE